MTRLSDMAVLRLAFLLMMTQPLAVTWGGVTELVHLHITGFVAGFLIREKLEGRF